ncbi:MAG TPA: hypothetical protein VFH03_00790 [Actinoplanes sp.]|nr:hypothetical protein [Actinoplanes sp.]
MPPEVGSEFHWNPAVLGAGPPLPPGHALFATGCGALIALLRRLAPRGRLHLPSYFCMGVAEALSADVPLAWYRHLPGERGPRLDTLRAVPGDVVLAQNLFGREHREPWDGWRGDHPGVVVVEDHSHDPFSGWARHSTAPYAVASLRKTLPLPDGGLLWSPDGLVLPQPIGAESPGAGLKLAAMLLKAAWLDGRAVAKDTFRTLQQRGEATLLGSTGPASAVTRAVLPLLDVAAVRAADVRNARDLAAALPQETPQWQVVGAGPFRVQVGCRSEQVRDALLAHLARHRIYAPVHWRQDRGGLWSGDLAAADLAARMLTVPVDHRCGPPEVQRVAEVLLRFRHR